MTFGTAQIVHFIGVHAVIKELDPLLSLNTPFRVPLSTRADTVAWRA